MKVTPLEEENLSEGEPCTWCYKTLEKVASLVKIALSWLGSWLSIVA